jgi:light-regulated signal transduction histidine kinase (bacteriophytochrome)
METAFQDVDLDAVVRGVVDTLHVALAERGVEVRLPRPLPRLRCDRSRVAEVFRNLISNASKYTVAAEKWVEVGYREPEEGGAPVFHVRDNGIGIPQRHHEAIFRIFKRLHARDEYGGGTGAGLTIVKKIVELHGGRIWLESQPGEGTTFYFTLSH